MISKKSNIEGVFEFFYSDRQLDQNLNPQEICADNFYVDIYVYMGLAFNIWATAVRTGSPRWTGLSRAEPVVPRFFGISPKNKIINSFWR